jgi:hypothetical protein
VKEGYERRRFRKEGGLSFYGGFFFWEGSLGFAQESLSSVVRKD